MGRASIKGFLRFVATVSAAVIAFGILHLFMLPVAYYVSFLLGMGAAALLIVCWSIPIIVHWIGNPQYGQDYEFDYESDRYQPIATFSSDWLTGRFVVSRKSKTLEFLKFWDSQFLKQQRSAGANPKLDHWFSSDLSAAIFFDNAETALKIALILNLIDRPLGEISVQQVGPAIEGVGFNHEADQSFF